LDVCYISAHAQWHGFGIGYGQTNFYTPVNDDYSGGTRGGSSIINFGFIFNFINNYLKTFY